MQIDFAENFSTFYQDEIQSAHWNKTQITVFTAALWQNGECLPAVLLSNDLSPSKESILIFLENVLFSLLQSDTKVLHIQSDGPSSQFKNNFIANCLSWFEKTFNAKVYWNFFASSHGKGPVDGIGDTIKQTAANVVTSHKGMITDSSIFADAVESISKVKAFHITSQDVAIRLAGFGLCQLVKNAPALPGISRAHHLEFLGNLVKCTCT